MRKFKSPAERKAEKNAGHIRIVYNMEFEERLAAQTLGYTWEQYQALVGDDEWLPMDSVSNSKATVIATYRGMKQVEDARGNGWG